MAAKRPYHRVNLKQSLLDAAVGLIGEVGPQVFTLREVARRAGVSHNAPYRHFRDKDDLLAAGGGAGFRAADRIDEESHGERPRPRRSDSTWQAADM